jgi:hypothetical protein
LNSIESEPNKSELKYRNEKKLYKSSELTIRTGLSSLTQCDTMQPQNGIRLWLVVGVECNPIQSFLSTRKESLNEENTTIRWGIGLRSFPSETEHGSLGVQSSIKYGKRHAQGLETTIATEIEIRVEME